MTGYFDTSALIKLLIDEPGSDDAASIWDAADAHITSRVAYPEGRAALAAAHRAGRITSRTHRAATSQLGDLLRETFVVELDAEVAFLAGDLAEAHALRGYDAVHLASAVAAQEADLALVTWDGDLARAGSELGLVVAQP